MVFKIVEITKKSSEQNCTNREHHVKNDKYVDYQDVKIYCTTN